MTRKCLYNEVILSSDLYNPSIGACPIYGSRPIELIYRFDRNQDPY